MGVSKSVVVTYPSSPAWPDIQMLPLRKISRQTLSCLKRHVRRKRGREGGKKNKCGKKRVSEGGKKEETK